VSQHNVKESGIKKPENDQLIMDPLAEKFMITMTVACLIATFVAFGLLIFELITKG